MKTTKLIRVEESIYDRISKHGEFKDSFSDILRRILDVYEKKK